MLITMRAILELADAKNIAIGAFNITSLEGIQAVLQAGEELNQPVILQFAPVHESIIPMSVIGPVMVMMAEKASVPVAVHLDHGDDLNMLKKALDMGFTSVMYDGSALSFEENAANTRIAVEMAGVYGASVEAEIGAMGRQEFSSIGEGEEGEATEGCYTDPEQAEQFAEATGIDALACSFGTVHGLYLTEPKLDFDRISQIRSRTGLPIVMHGGSGVSDQDFRKCIENGVRKINYYTYLAKAGGMHVKEKAMEGSGYVFYHDVTLWGIEAMKKDVLHTIKVFSNLD
ncbi:class II fructose-bisphosphate aldolase [Lacrimispora saccharolytica]|uniref:Ketose-bisphosphate aldolase n=1 Tax=Lacrimispora saccharolytica (strain ATCC 35040 / DSM 2544 / NRCC 2533 / WM1) TaxID=610130 RepID=D9R7R2_LACSW|nr:class II fructose-bisphosphate aldolase [Lacrimispora saccharolytica]ADL05566.1 ketose-bisphosphate aldolase [[Clostridium] saccharolyticum WM1]QRV20274.1 class II fructose-bisphosphate aldolase [Lacrimispora saccharolytica]